MNDGYRLSSTESHRLVKMVSNGGAHPAFRRFESYLTEMLQILFIKAARGTGRRLFAETWFDGQPGRILDWSEVQSVDVLDRSEIDTLLLDQPDLRLAVLLPPHAPHWVPHLMDGALVADHEDLILNKVEAHEYLSFRGVARRDERETIYEAVGGWLVALRTLSGDQSNLGACEQIIRVGLLPYLDRDNVAEFKAAVTLLPIVDQMTVDEFYNENAPNSFQIDDLASFGVLILSAEDQWRAPRVVQKIVREYFYAKSAELAEQLDYSAIRALATSRDLNTAVSVAVEHALWDALEVLLLERWPELLLSDSLLLTKVMKDSPKYISQKTGYLRVGLHTLSAIGSEEIGREIPSVKPEFQIDATAQMIRLSVEKFYRSGNSDKRAVSVGTLEVTYLRMRGLFRESAESAKRLRRFLDQIHPSFISAELLGFAQRSAAIALQLEERVVEARWAYENCLQHGRESGSSFLVGDAAAKLALLDALDGNNAEATQRITEPEEMIPRSGWGREVVQRSVILAQAYVALTNLDLKLLKQLLGKLPKSPDTEEFWAVHAYILAIYQALKGAPQAARRLIADLLDARRYSLSAMTRRMLAGAGTIINILDPEATDDGEADGEGHIVLKAFLLILGHRFDAAISILDSRQNREGVLRWENFRFYLRLAASNPEGPTEDIAHQISTHHRQAGVLLDIALLSTVSGWSNISELINLTTEEKARLDSIRHLFPEKPRFRPQLTPREKELLHFLRIGLSRKEIAARSFRTENTIKTHQRSLYRKLEASDARTALENARRWRL